MVSVMSLLRIVKLKIFKPVILSDLLKGCRILMLRAATSSEPELLSSCASFSSSSMRVPSSPKRCITISGFFCFNSHSSFIRGCLEWSSFSRAANFSAFFTFLSEDVFDFSSWSSFCWLLTELWELSSIDREALSSGSAAFLWRGVWFCGSGLLDRS